MKKFSSVILPALVAAAPAFAAGEPAPLVLAERGICPEYAIVIPSNASASVSYAAAELKRYVRRLTDAELPIVTDEADLPPKAIILGNTRHTAGISGLCRPALGEEGFRITARPPHLLVEGSSVRGVLFGVYELLERFGGVGWYASWMTDVPELDSFAVPGDFSDSQRPAFDYRNLYFGDATGGDFAAHLRVNGDSNHLLDRHGRNSRHRFVRGLGACHTLPSLMPHQEFFDTHPEYFAMVDGKRIPDGQLCLTNPDVIRILTERVLERIADDPVAPYYGVSCADTLKWCECPRCVAAYNATESLSGPLIALVNHIAHEVDLKHSGKTIETLAYRHTRKPPKNIRVRPNVLICFCTFFCDFKDPLRTGANAMSRRTLSDLEGWSALTGNIMVWDYMGNYMHNLMPHPDALAYQDNLRLYRDAGAKKIIDLGVSRTSDFAPLKAWLLSKLLWNPDEDVPALLDRFFAGYFGKAAPLVRRYFDELYLLPRDTEAMPLTFYEDIDEGNLTDEFLSRAIATLSEAEKAVEDDPPRASNVRLAKLSPVFTLLLRRARLNTPAPAEGPLSNKALLAFFRRSLEEFEPVSIADRSINREDDKAAIFSLDRAEREGLVGR